MGLKEGARTIVEQCLNVSADESVLLLNDGNDKDLIEALKHILDEKGCEFHYIEYETPENHGEEPPEHVAKEMKKHDVFIAPTKKSISHTEARIEACENGARGATLPSINKEIWNSSLQADYGKVSEISREVYEMIKETTKIRVKTPSGTDLKIKINPEYFHTDTGIIHEPGGFGNLPAGEADGAATETKGSLVIDHLPQDRESEGLKILIENNKVQEIENKKDKKLEQKFETVKGAKNIAEFGFGTNPEAELIGTVLQDEKVFGTVHIAFGDNSSYIPKKDEKRVEAGIHWDTVCKKPTVWFDDQKVLDEGIPVFKD